MNKTMILTHADCDGMCAGAIALARFPGAGVFFTKPVSICEDLRNMEAEMIVICDIAINKAEQQKFIGILAGKKARIMYFDHHPLSKEAKKQLSGMLEFFVNDEQASSSELVYRHFQKELPKEMVWPALYGAIGDYEENTEFVRSQITNYF